ncbi:hypothetical protein [Streptomyces sp. NPDC056361]|uniref:hypothetical protein n=1 Tax=Streptomyces sp. NPDC056361 TaxID=3345795 RepID=UPI0035D92773
MALFTSFGSGSAPVMRKRRVAHYAEWATVPPGGAMSGVAELLRRTWLDWAVFVYMVVAAARCKSPIAAGLFTAFAAMVALVAARQTWKLVHRARVGLTPSATEAEAHHRS